MLWVGYEYILSSFGKKVQIPNGEECASWAPCVSSDTCNICGNYYLFRDIFFHFCTNIPNKHRVTLVCLVNFSTTPNLWNKPKLTPSMHICPGGFLCFSYQYHFPCPFYVVSITMLMCWRAGVKKWVFRPMDRRSRLSGLWATLSKWESVMGKWFLLKGVQ